MQVDAFFDLKEITDEEKKYKYMIVHADQRVLRSIGDVMKDTFLANSYKKKNEAIRKRICEVFDKNDLFHNYPISARFENLEATEIKGGRRMYGDPFKRDFIKK